MRDRPTSDLIPYHSKPAWIDQSMSAWKPLAVAVIALFGTPVMAAENNNPFQAALMLTTVVPAVIVSGATAATSSIPDLFKSAKGDALAFIGSDGEIRGAQLEQASSTLPPGLRRAITA